MKKIFTFIALFTIALFANAQPDNCAYFANSNVQVGADGTIDLMINADNEIGSIYLEYELPEGVTIKEITSTPGANININEELGLFLMGNNNYYTTGKVATFHVSVADNVEIGEYPITILVSKIVEPNLTTYTVNNIVASLTVQKTAVIEEMPEGFGVNVNPFVAEDGNVILKFNYKSPVNIKNLSFDIQLPEGMFFMNDADWDPDLVASTLEITCIGNGTGDPTIYHSYTSDDVPTSAKITISGTYNAKTKKYIKASTSLAPLAKMTACVITQHDIDDYDWDKEIMTEGISTLKLSNIVLVDVDGNTYTGEYLASVIYGQPKAQEAILYGHYSSSVASAFSTALKNVATIDVTAATVDEGVKFTDVLVNENGGNSYYTRTSANYGTTVLPLDLTTDNADKLYTIESMDSESIVLAEAEQVPANTPCIFKGTINVEGATPTLGVPSEQGLGQTTFKGTYSATNIASGDGYYISSDGKFYGDGATVRPFRGYFDGAIAGVKSLRVLLDDATGLIDITDQFSKEDIYNLQGIRMNTVQKGAVNIKGGKKVLVK